MMPQRTVTLICAEPGGSVINGLRYDIPGRPLREIATMYRPGISLEEWDSAKKLEQVQAFFTDLNEDIDNPGPSIFISVGDPNPDREAWPAGWAVTQFYLDDDGKVQFRPDPNESEWDIKLVSTISVSNWYVNSSASLKKLLEEIINGGQGTILEVHATRRAEGMRRVREIAREFEI